jgi:hypothetical protein
VYTIAVYIRYSMSDINLRRVAEEDFFVLMGMDTLPDSEKADILRSINDTVQARVYLAVYDQLSVLERQEMDVTAPDQLISFLKNKGFDLPQMIIEESIRYRFELAHLMHAAISPLTPVA